MTPEVLWKKHMIKKADEYLEELSDSESSDEPEEIEPTIVPVRHTKNEQVFIDKNCYSLTIAAYLTDTVSWRHKQYALG